MGLSSKTIRFEGVRFHLYCSPPSEKPPLLLLHGFMDSSHTFRRILPRLMEKYRVYAPDIPGFGGSELPPVRELWDIRSMARMLLRYTLFELKLSRIELLSHSMGGVVALHMQQEAERFYNIELFRRMHCIAPGVVKLNPKDRNETRKKLFPISVAEVEELIHNLYPARSRKIPGFLLKGLLYEWSKLGYYYLAENTVAEESRIFFTRNGLGKIQTELVLYWGKEDRITPVKLAETICQARPNTPLHIFKECGHLLHLEEPGLFLETFYGKYHKVKETKNRRKPLLRKNNRS